MIISYLVFFPMIFISQIILIFFGKQFDFIEDLLFSSKWTLLLVISFSIIDLLESYSFAVRKFHYKKSKKAIVIIGSLFVVVGFILPRVDTLSILVILLVLIVTDLVRNKIVFGRFWFWS